MTSDPMSAEPFVLIDHCLGAAIVAAIGGVVALVVGGVALVGALVCIRVRPMLATRPLVRVASLAMGAATPVVLYAGTSGCRSDPDITSRSWMWIVATMLWAVVFVALTIAARKAPQATSTGP